MFSTLLTRTLYGMRVPRKQRKLLLLIVFVLTLVIYIGQQRGWFDGIQQAAEVNQPGLYTVTKFDDGDTIQVDMNGKTETLRFVGVDTPETHDPRKAVQCYGPEASAYTKKLIGNSRVRLASDPDSTNRDRYDRLLRYVYLPDGTLVNENLIQNGYGFYYPYFPFTKSAQFDHDEQTAKAANKGLWAHCKPTPTDGGGYTSNNRGT
jgi:endonuclease YncB( thermonuclease family)